MTRSAANPLARLLVALAMTLAALFGSVAFASAASADDDDRDGSSVSVQSDHDDDDDDDDEKDAEKAARKAAEEAEKAAKKAAEEAEKAAKDAVKEQVEYADGDVIDKLGNVVAKKAPQLTTKFEEIAPALRNLVATALTKKGATVIYDARGRLVIAPYLCNPKVLKLLQPGCVTSLPTSGGGRF